MMTTQPASPAPRPTLSQHILVALALAAISLAAYAVVDYGNNMGIDDWIHYYQSYFLHTPSFSGRPLALILLTIAVPFLKADYFSYHIVLLFIRALTAFLSYLLIWQLAPKQKLFAVACGGAVAVFLLRDTFYVFTLLYPNDNFSSLVTTLIALNLFVGALSATWSGKPQPYLLTGVALLAGVAASLIRESGIPLLLGLPAIVTLLKRPKQYQALGFCALWYLVIIASAMRYVLPILGFGPATYGSGLFQDFNVARMLSASLNQFEFAFFPVIQTDVLAVYQQNVAIVLTLIVVLGAALMLVPKLWRIGDELNGRFAVGYYGMWLIGGVISTWLGFAAFLPTVYASSGIRTHILSGPAEAIVLVSAVWLVSCLSRSVNWRLIIRLAGLAFIVAYGVSMTGRLQAEFYSFAATWENTSYFMRSLAHLAPAVKSPTLFVYIENPEIEETPFVSGSSFQYAVRYFYGDTATGLVPTDNILGSWSVSDAGILMDESWIAHPHLYGWNEIIVVTRESSGHLLFLDTLPERFLTAYRQSLYHPLDRIEPSFIPARIQETFPSLSSPDWSGNDYLLQNP